MRVVLDTNIVVSGLLWRGAPRQVLEAARTGLVELFTSRVLLAELEEVLKRPKFAERLQLANLEPQTLLEGYAALAQIIEPTTVVSPVIVSADPDDDAVVVCAISAEAEAIVSGDSHLLSLKHYRNIQIINAANMAQWVEELSQSSE